MANYTFYDTLEVLNQCRAVIAEVQLRGSPTLTEGEEMIYAVRKLIDFEILDRHSPGSWQLSPHFLAALDEVAPGRNFGRYTGLETERVALLWSER